MARKTTIEQYHSANNFNIRIGRTAEDVSRGTEIRLTYNHSRIEVLLVFPICLLCSLTGYICRDFQSCYEVEVKRN
jgi:hypothetical protein